MQILDKLPVNTEKSVIFSIKEKKGNFGKIFNQKYSDEYIRDYVIDNNYLEAMDHKMLGTSLYLTMVGLIFFMFNSLNLSPIWFLVSLIQMPVVLWLRSARKPLRFFAKLWLKKKERRDMIESEMFLNSYVEQDILKVFIDEYGKEELYDLLRQKDNITYKEMMDKSVYLNNKKMSEEKRDTEKSDKDKREKALKEAVNILADMP